MFKSGRLSLTGLLPIVRLFGFRQGTYPIGTSNHVWLPPGPASPAPDPVTRDPGRSEIGLPYRVAVVVVRRSDLQYPTDRLDSVGLGVFRDAFRHLINTLLHPIFPRIDSIAAHCELYWP